MNLSRDFNWYQSTFNWFSFSTKKSKGQGCWFIWGNSAYYLGGTWAHGGSLCELLKMMFFDGVLIRKWVMWENICFKNLPKLWFEPRLQDWACDCTAHRNPIEILEKTSSAACLNASFLEKMQYFFFLWTEVDTTCLEKNHKQGHLQKMKKAFGILKIENTHTHAQKAENNKILEKQRTKKQNI